MKKLYTILFLSLTFFLKAQEKVSLGTTNTQQVFYSLEKGITGSIALNDWDIAIEPQGDYAIRINEAVGTRVWVKTDDVRENCDLGLLNCKGLQEYIPENYDTTGMASGSGSWVELHNSYDNWKEGALNQEKQSLSSDIVGYGWGGYKAFSSSPAHAIIGYRIFILKLRDGSFKQFFVRKSLSAGYDVAYSNLDGSEVVEKTILRENYENKLFAYLSLIDNNIHNPEPVAADWELLFTPYPPQKTSENQTVEAGILHNHNLRTSQTASTTSCVTPGEYSENISTIGTDWKLFDQHYFVEAGNGAIYQVKPQHFTPNDYTFSVLPYNPSELSSSHTSTNITCNGCTNGSAKVIAAGGVCPYTILWENGAAEFEIDNLSPGSYDYTVTDNNGNTTMGTATILPYDCDFTITEFQIQEPSCNGSNNGEITVITAGGEAPYSYNWGSFGNTSTIENLSTGAYPVEITDSKGCIVEDIAVLTEPDSLKVTANIMNESCFECKNGAANLNITGGNSPYTVRWPDGENLTERENLNPGSYFIKITDSKGCVQQINVTILEFGCNLLIDRVAYNMPSCNGEKDGSITPTFMGAQGEITYNWNTGANTPSLSGIGAGEYWLVITDETGCRDSSNFVLNEPSKIEVTVSEENPTCESCQDGNISLFVSGGEAPYTYKWSNNIFTFNNNNLSSGTYAYTVTDSKGCEKVGNVSISAPVGINELTFQNTFIYPNPANSFFQIDSEVDINFVKIFNSKGVLIHQENTSNNTLKVKTEEWNNGLYFVQIQSNTGLQTHKIHIIH